MLRLDDNFLNELGLGSMPDHEKKPFIAHIYDELEQRVGVRLSKGLTNQQMEEFELIASGSKESISRWLESNVPDYQNRSDYANLATASGLVSGSPELDLEYASSKWFDKNIPGYQKEIEQELNIIKEEIKKNKDAILGL